VRTRNLLNRLVDEQLTPGDLVAILRTGGGVGALQQFTTDKRLLKAAIAGLSITSRRRGNVDAAALYREQTSTGEGPSGASNADPAGAALAAAAASLDALIGNMERERQLQLTLGTLGALEAVVRALAPLPGRKSLLLLSEGFSRIGSRGDTTRVPDRLRQLVDIANRASVVVYTLNPAGLETFLPGAASGAGTPKLFRVSLGFQEEPQRFVVLRPGRAGGALRRQPVAPALQSRQIALLDGQLATLADGADIGRPALDLAIEQIG
jgi:VWFA-related protein